MAEPIISRRRFRSENGDWKKLESVTKEIIILSESIEAQIEKLIKDQHKLQRLSLDAYNLCPSKDCLYYDSPVSPSKVLLYFKLQLRKSGWDGIRDIYTPTVSIEPFSKMMKDACRWLLKFKDDKEI